MYLQVSELKTKNYAIFGLKFKFSLYTANSSWCVRRVAKSQTSSPKGNDRSPEIKQVFSNSSQVSMRFFQFVNGSQLCSPWLDQNLTSIKGCNSVANLQKQ